VKKKKMNLDKKTNRLHLIVDTVRLKGELPFNWKGLSAEPDTSSFHLPPPVGGVKEQYSETNTNTPERDICYVISKRLTQS